MKDINQSRLASVLALLVGVWVALSPAWITMSSGARISTLLTGIVIIAASATQYFIKNTLPSWINGAAAAWLFLSMFTFSMGTAAAWSAVLSAIAVVILSTWDGVEVDHYTHRPIART